MRSNQNSAKSLAATPALTFTGVVREAMRMTARSAQTDPSGKQLLWDIARGRNMQTLHRAADVARTCTNAADALALPDALRAYIIAGCRAFAASGVDDALRAENLDDTEEDRALFEYLRHRTHPNRERAIEALRRQETASRRAIDALMAESAEQSLVLLR